MKKLCRFLAERGYSSETFEGLLSFKVSRESKLFPAASPDEVNAILNVIDRRVPRGNRDYAIILLGVVTGLRVGEPYVKQKLKLSKSFVKSTNNVTV